MAKATPPPITLLFRAPWPAEKAQIMAAREQVPHEVYAALKLCAVAWTGTDEKFSQDAIEGIPIEHARRLLLDLRASLKQEKSPTHAASD